MYYVYAVYSIEYDKIYIGSSSDIIKRLNSHNNDKNRGWSAKYRPWILVYSESLPGKHQALMRERQLKTFRGREFLRSQIKNQLIPIAIGRFSPPAGG